MYDAKRRRCRYSGEFDDVTRRNLSLSLSFSRIRRSFLMQCTQHAISHPYLEPRLNVTKESIVKLNPPAKVITFVHLYLRAFFHR